MTWVRWYLNEWRKLLRDVRAVIRMRELYRPERPHKPPKPDDDWTAR